MPRRPRRGRSYDPRRLPAMPVAASAGAASLVAAPAALALGTPFALLAVALFVISATLFGLLIVYARRHPHPHTRTLMIQDLLKGLFGTPDVPASSETLSAPNAAPPAELAPPVAQPAAPAATRASQNPKLPTVARPVVEAIEAKIERVLANLGNVQIGDITAYEMTQLRDVHLPELVSSYIDIPADHRARIFQEKGKSASYVLKDSLEVISARLDDTIARLAEREISTFDDANRFITDRYGSKKDPFA